MRNDACLMVMLLALLSPVSTFAATGLTVTPNGNDTVLLQSLDLKEMSSVEISFGWDTTLGEPRVSVQGGNVTGMLTNAGGGMTVKVVRDDPDAVLSIEVGFDKPGDMSRAISNVAVNASDPGGASYPLPVDFEPPEATPHWELPATEAASSGEAQATGQSAKPNLDNVPRKSGEGGALAGTHQAAGSIPTVMAAPVGEPQTTAPDPPGEGDARPSVLQRFREYKGETGLREFTALFVRKGEGIRQEPSVAIVDGKTPVRISLELEPRDGYAPNFALSDARFVSLHKSGEKSWVMTVVPNEGALEVRLILRTGKEKVEFPLVVAPQIKMFKGINEKNFLDELAKYLADQAAGRTSSSAPSRRYLQEYVFTANFLANLTTTP